MRILHLSTYDTNGGAARAAFRIHTSLVEAGTDSHMLVQKKSSNDSHVRTLKPISALKRKLCSRLDRLPTRFYRKRTQTLFSVARLGRATILKQIEKIQPDIVHVHWICDAFLQIEQFAKIQYPLIFSLHDMWAFTGGCHYDEHCEGYKKQCKDCQVLNSKNCALSQKIWKRKQDIYARLENLTVVGLSHWITKCSKSSALLKTRLHINIPNSIDTTLYRPIDRSQIGNKWSNLPENKKIVLFGAMGATTDKRKGHSELMRALENSTLNREEIALVIFGSEKEEVRNLFGFTTYFFGHISKEEELIDLYNIANCVVIPSLQENLSNAILESLACGTPVVSFDIGGNADMISHHQNGYLAKPYDTTDLAHGIGYILNTKNYDEFCANARQKILDKFDNKVVAKEYRKLYQSIIHSL